MTRTAPDAAPESGGSSPGKTSGRRARSLLLERLRARVAALETGGIEAAPNPIAPDEQTDEHPQDATAPAQGWPLELAEIDRHLPQTGLAANGVHEIAPAAYGDMPAALGFAAALAIRRLESAPADARPLLWCRLSAGTREWGRLYGHGLEALGLSRRRLLTVTLNKPDAVLWTLEEALKSTALAGVVADVGTNVGTGLDLTAVRRLMLAANEGRTPALLVFPAPPEGGTAARTRWIVATETSVPPPFDDSAPGAPAWNLRLVRCRGGRPGEWFVEWSHATHRFALAPAVSGRTAGPGYPRDIDIDIDIDQPAAGSGAGRGPRLAARRL